jgi:hypothetical protein
MWRTCSPQQLTPSSFVQAATFCADISVLADMAQAEAALAEEDTGSVRVLHLVGPMRQPALVVSHQLGAPEQIEVRLLQRGTTSEPAASLDDLRGVLAVFGKSELDCTWVTPALKDKL